MKSVNQKTGATSVPAKFATSELNRDGLKIKVLRSSLGARVLWSGISDNREPGPFLDPWLAELAETLTNTPMVIDFRDMEFMNSATFHSVNVAMRRLDQCNAPIKVLYRQDIAWQRVSFRCLRVIAASQMPNIKVTSEP